MSSTKFDLFEPEFDPFEPEQDPFLAYEDVHTSANTSEDEQLHEQLHQQLSMYAGLNASTNTTANTFVNASTNASTNIATNATASLLPPPTLVYPTTNLAISAVKDWAHIYYSVIIEQHSQKGKGSREQYKFYIRCNYGGKY